MDIVKLKNPKKKGEAKRRWRVEYIAVETGALRRLDTATHRQERGILLSAYIPISFCERLTKRY